MATSYLDKFAKHTGWINLEWTTPPPPSLAGLFPKGCTLLLGVEGADFFTLTWLDQELRWHAIRGFIPQSLSGQGSLGVETKLKVDGKESEDAYVLTLTAGEGKGKPQLRGAIDPAATHRGPGSGTLGVFIAEADPMTEGPGHRGFRGWLRRFLSTP